jgi:hypothetical protein
LLVRSGFLRLGRIELPATRLRAHDETDARLQLFPVSFTRLSWNLTSEAEFVFPQKA